MNSNSPMFEYISGFASQLREGYSLGMELKELPEGTFNSIIICGMGGSAIGGHLLLDLFRSKIRLPAGVNRGYILPGWVNEGTFAIFSSYSGNTGETLSCLTEAMERGTKCLAITGGGKLEELCWGVGFPMVRIPEGLPPRAALGYSLAPLFAIFERLGIIEPGAEDLLEAANFVESLTEKFSHSSGEPAKLAQELQGKIPLFYADGFSLDAVVTRFKCQIMENAKSLAFNNVFPELNHNEIVGWGGPEFTKEKFVAIFLWDPFSLPNVEIQMKAARKILSDIGVKTYDIKPGGETFVQQMMYLVHFGDWLSYHLAMFYGVDPVPIERIDLLKRKLVEERG